MYGAALLYNYLLAEMDKREELVSKYTEDLDRWHAMVQMREDVLHDWDTAAFWSLVTAHGRIPAPTQHFVRRWLSIVLGEKDIPRIEEDKRARDVIRKREIFLKGGRSRFKSKQHRELWGGAAGNFQMDYRWWVTKRIANDIIEGLQGD